MIVASRPGRTPPLALEFGRSIVAVEYDRFARRTGMPVLAAQQQLAPESLRRAGGGASAPPPCSLRPSA